MFFAMIII